MGALIDTSLLIRTERGGRWFDIDDEEVAISAITASELRHGVHRAATVQQRTRREAFITRMLRLLPVIPFDDDVAHVHARIWAELSTRGNNPGAHDLIIAATALTYDWSVATGNPKDFERVPGLRVLTPPL